MSKIRFVANIGGETKRLLTVDENAKGALQVIVDSRGHSNPQLGSEAFITENRFSIHLSSRSSTAGNLAHKTLTFAKGDPKHTYNFSQAVPNGGFQPLETFTVLDIRGVPPYDPPRAGVYELGAYNPETHTMYFGVWFAAANAELPPITTCRVLQVQFRRYSLIIPVAFTSEPTPADGVSVNYFTTAPEKMTLEQAKAGIIPGISGGVPPPLVEANMIQEFNRLIRGELSGDFVIEQPVQEAPLFTANPNA